MSATLFFDLDNTLCRPRTPFLSVFLESCAPLLASPLVDAQTLLRAWAEALEAPGHSTTAGCLARALATCGALANEHLVAAGYGEYQPLSLMDTARNRRIELKLTNR